MSWYSDPIVDIWHGNCLEVLAQLQESSVQLCLSSPPYWGLRVYGGSGDPGVWGLEETPEEYVAHLVELGRAIRRVLRPEGSFVLVLGDTYAGSVSEGHQADHRDDYLRQHPQGKKLEGRLWLRPKQKLLMPYRVAMALQDNGWLLRDECIWAKPNNTPGSQKDRLTCTTERIFRFVKNDRTILWRNRETGEWRETRPGREEQYPWGGMYMHPETEEMSWKKLKDWLHIMPLWAGFDHYFELDVIRVPHKSSSITRAHRNFGPDKDGWAEAFGGNPPGGLHKKQEGIVPFNLRVRDAKRGKGGLSAFGEIRASEEEKEGYSYPETPRDQHRQKDDVRLHRDHLALPPQPELDPERAFHPLGKNPGDVLSAMPVRHKSWASNPSHPYTHDYTGKPQNPGDYWEITTKGFSGHHFAVFPEAIVLPWVLACTRPGDIVLDPMMGSGTTLVVAKKLGRKSVGIDIVEEYCEIAKKRLEEIPLPLEAKEGKA